MLRRGWLAFVSVLALACGGPPADTPSAVILITPGTICENDAHATSILLDGTMSSRHLTLVPLPPEDTAYPDGATVAPLAFQWTLEGDAYTIVDGTLTSRQLTVTAAGERPLHVSLTTTNLAGGSATSLRTLPITLPTTWPRRCTSDADCPGGACDLAAMACVGSTHCTSSAGCDPCFVCDATRMACVPRSP